MPIFKNVSGLHTPMERCKILLLDDDAELCEVLKSVLEWRNYEVTAVHRGVEGIREILAHDYDAVICDMMMPTMPGDMFYLAVRQAKPHLCERFIFITAHLGNPKIDSFLRLTSGRVLYKPLATNQLLAKIAEVIASTPKPEEKILVAVRPEPSGNQFLADRDSPCPHRSEHNGEVRF